MPPSSFDQSEIEAICRELAECMTGSELADILDDAGVRHDSRESTKWKRLRDSLRAQQVRDGHGGCVHRVIEATMRPLRLGHPVFSERRDSLNLKLVFLGLSVGADGRLSRTQVASTHAQARKRAATLRSTLHERGVHQDVLNACRSELLADNYFHAVLEATKSLAEKIRSRTGLDADGAGLCDAAFGLGNQCMPPLAFNRLETPTECSEHRGLHNILKGIFGAFRNPTAHAPKPAWPITEGDALDLLQTCSLLHRRLDAADVTPAAPSRRP